MKRLLACGALVCGAVAAQSLDLKTLDGLASKAKESEIVNLDAATLKLASGFLSAQDADQAKARKLISGISAINVRTFEFDSDSAYSPSELDPVRAQLKSPGWSKIVETKEAKESTEVYLHTTDGKMSGFAVLALEPRELTVVNIVGSLDMETLASLGGSFGVPDVPEIRKLMRPPASTKTKE